MDVRTGLVAALLSALVALAGAVIAAIAVVGLAVVAPGVAEGSYFFWASAVVATLLQGALAFAGARVALRRIRDAGFEAPSVQAVFWVACTGPVLVAVMTQLGVAAEGEAWVALMPICASLLGGLVGVVTGRRAVPAGR